LHIKDGDVTKWNWQAMERSNGNLPNEEVKQNKNYQEVVLE